MSRKIIFSKKEGVSEGYNLARIVHIIEKETSNQEYMVGVAFSIGGEIVWKNLVFPNPEEANLIKKEFLDSQNQNFLRLLGQPYEGVVDVDPKKWVDKYVGVIMKKEVYDGIARAAISGFAEKEVAAQPELPNTAELEDIPF